MSFDRDRAKENRKSPSSPVFASSCPAQVITPFFVTSIYPIVHRIRISIDRRRTLM